MCAQHSADQPASVTGYEGALSVREGLCDIIAAHLIVERVRLAPDAEPGGHLVNVVHAGVDVGRGGIDHDTDRLTGRQPVIHGVRRQPDLFDGQPFRSP
jgi:hypothetical protein